MARPKKVIEDSVVGIEDIGEDGSVEVPPVEVSPIGPVTLDFGRTDLNEMRDKLNKVIEFVDGAS